MGTLQKKVAAAASWQRVDEQTTQATIVTGSSILHRITVTGSDGAAGTLTVSDGETATAANILTILEIPADTSKTFEFGVNMSNGIMITPGEATTDSVVIYN